MIANVDWLSLFFINNISAHSHYILLNIYYL